ncbi:MAG: apolipoprotein N-acyltransferase [Pseudomonadota bacterium]
MAERGLSAETPGWPLVSTGWRRWTTAGLAGAAAGLGQVPFALWPLSLLGFTAAFVLLLKTHRAAGGFQTGWAFGTGYFLVTLHWIVEPFLVDAARHGWMAPFALAGLSGGLAMFWGAAFAVAGRLARRPVALALAWTGAVTLAELLRGHVLTGFPWALPGYIWIDTPLAQLAAFVGPYGLTLLSLAYAAALALAITSQTRAPWVVATLALTPAWLLLDPGPPASGAAIEGRPVIRLVQPNAAQHEKWDPDKINTFFQRQLAYTAAVADTTPDLIVWSETAIAWDISTNALARSMMSDAAKGIPVAVGIQRFLGEDAFNSLAVLDGDGSVGQIYDKHHLVPFGEYMPARWLTEPLGLAGLASVSARGFTPGPGPELLDFGPLGTALPLICYEAIFPRNVSNAPARPDWLLQVTNDAWFGKTAGPQQHLAQARSRAIEQGLPMVRSANTGISGVIDAHGRVIAGLPLNEAGFIDAPLPAPFAPTLYSRTGDTPVWVLALFLIGIGALFARRKHH